MRIAKQEREIKMVSKTVENKDLLNTHTFSIDMKVASGETFQGTFTVHRPTVGERIRISVLEAQELGGMQNVDLLGSNLAHMVATFQVVIDDAPVWWKPKEIRDLEVLQMVYQKYVDYLQQFQKSTEFERAG